MENAETSKAPAVISRRGGRPLVSFFLAGRNVEAFVEETVRSMLAQTCGDFELLFLDDASTDSTHAIVKGFQDPRLTVLRNDVWQGIPRSLNRLLDMLRGEFWAHMDADDICLPKRLETQLELMRRNPELCVCGCSYHMFVPNGDVYKIDLPRDNDDIRASLLFFSPVPHPFATLRGDFFRRNSIKYAEKMKYALDYELWTRIAVRHPEAGFMNSAEPLGLYRRHRHQISTAKLEEQAQMATRAQMQIFLALGFPPTSKLLRAHRHIFHHAPVNSPTEMDELFGWCAALRLANARKRLFPVRQFEQLLTQALLDIAAKHPQFAAPRIKALERWVQSPAEY
jgi:glycosyltransferase involved in cell wall biosynthesis